jgi:hypothetical protein
VLQAVRLRRHPPVLAGQIKIGASLFLFGF